MAKLHKINDSCRLKKTTNVLPTLTAVTRSISATFEFPTITITSLHNHPLSQSLLSNEWALQNLYHHEIMVP